jgi:hypothetical protein
MLTLSKSLSHFTLIVNKFLSAVAAFDCQPSTKMR